MVDFKLYKKDQSGERLLRVTGPDMENDINLIWAISSLAYTLRVRSIRSCVLEQKSHGLQIFRVQGGGLVVGDNVNACVTWSKTC